MLQNIADVRGFTCWGSHVGIKSKRRDLGLIFSEVPASAAAVFTRNVVKAEPIKASKPNLEDGRLQAFVVNSGNANACTGKQGYDAAMAMMEVTAEALGIDQGLVLVASTGIIGEPFPTEKVVEGIREAVHNLSNRNIAGSLTANAILTTDTFAKEGFLSFELGGKEIRMGGIAKGSGMIHPNMGTMLGFIVCDVAIEASLVQKALAEVVEDSFNMITVDGDTSTNDMVAIMCNGKAGNEAITTEDKDYELFKAKLQELCAHLAKLIVSDGEGSTKFIEYQVMNAPDNAAARQIVRTVSDSSLVKTAMFGKDPNWGRIVAAAGRAGVDFDPDKIDLYIGADQERVQLVKNGQPVEASRQALKKKMNVSNIRILLDLNMGSGKAIGWGSDFSYEYVRINAEYTT